MIADSRASKEMFDRWFADTDQDPWGYAGAFVTERLEKSLAVVSSHLASDFGGTFVEVGAFNGAFTRQISAFFPDAKIMSSDIVNTAWEEAAVKSPFANNVSFQCADMLELSLAGVDSQSPVVLLLLECLYYLPAEQRVLAVQKLLKNLPTLRYVFVSGPLDGGIQYFDELALRRLFEAEGVMLKSVHVLNTNDAFRTKFSWDGDPIIQFLVSFPVLLQRCLGRFVNWRVRRLNAQQARVLCMLDKSPRHRRRYARQVMFCFAPEK